MSDISKQQPADPVVFALMIAREFIDPDRDPLRMSSREVVELINIALNHRKRGLA